MKIHELYPVATVVPIKYQGYQLVSEPEPGWTLCRINTRHYTIPDPRAEHSKASRWSGTRGRVPGSKPGPYKMRPEYTQHRRMVTCPSCGLEKTSAHTRRCGKGRRDK
jgi:hypothetical protein